LGVRKAHRCRYGFIEAHPGGLHLFPIGQDEFMGFWQQVRNSGYQNEELLGSRGDFIDFTDMSRDYPIQEMHAYDLFSRLHTSPAARILEELEDLVKGGAWVNWEVGCRTMPTGLP